MIRHGYLRETIAIGQVHLGVGAFMRAHTAVYTDLAIAASGGNWGIAGVSLRRRTVSDQLKPQDCLYTVMVRDSQAASHRLVGAIKSIDVAPDDPQKIVRLLADPSITVVTITVTEKGYCLAADSGALNAYHPDIVHDLEYPEMPCSVPGFLVAALQLRRQRNSGSLAILSCDNLPSNGTRLQRAVLDLADHADSTLRSWIEDNVRFPATMVDRIVPATTKADIEACRTAIGLYDAALVTTEAFHQWIIEDRFTGERPDWEAAGALFVTNVEPYESAKLRLLNGPHSALAYLGYLAGYADISEVVEDYDFARFARLLMTHEISPVTPEPSGMRHDMYIDAVLRRFANASLRHPTRQIAMDGSQKLPQRLLGTIRAQLRCGGPVAGLCLAVAGWMRYVLGFDESGARIDVQDPLAERFAGIAADAGNDVDYIVGRFAALPDVFGTDLQKDARFLSTVGGYLRQLLAAGAAAAVHEYVSGHKPDESVSVSRTK